MCSNSVHPQLRDYFQPRRRPFRTFSFTPLEPSNENIFVNQLKGALKKDDRRIMTTEVRERKLEEAIEAALVTETVFERKSCRTNYRHGSSCARRLL